MNYLIIHGGGPTSVINTSLYGAITELNTHIVTDKVYGAIGGIQAIFSEDYLDLTDLPNETLEALLITPGSFLGSSRYPLEDTDYGELARLLHQQNISGVLINGGNGSMDTCGKLAQACLAYKINVIGIPKTIDNDLACIDHSPGYSSAAYYIASTVAEIVQDVRSLPIHVCVIEVMGRNAGWLAASASFAGTDSVSQPDLIYTSEIPFSKDIFLKDVKAKWELGRGVIVVVSEGLLDLQGEPVSPLIYSDGRSQYYGDVSAYLANLIIKELGIKARNEKPGLAGRTDISKRSKVDLSEAVEVGRIAAKTVMNGLSNYMVGIQRKSTAEYEVEFPLIPLKEVMMVERTMPRHFLNEAGNGVTQAFIDWATPLIDFTPPNFARRL